MSSLGTPVLLVAFLVAAVAVWLAGNKVSETTDVLSSRFGLGEAMGGMIVLAIVTNLPELAIVCSGAARGDLSLAVGNILGGIAAQTVVLAVLDRFGPGDEPLTYRAASPAIVLEGLLLVLILGLVVVGTQMPVDLVVARTTPVAVLIVVTWLVGVKVIAAAGSGAPAAMADTGTTKVTKEAKQVAKEQARSTTSVGAIFGIAAAVTLVAGVVLEQSSEVIAGRIGMSGAVFGATVLALATSLPELSTGLTSLRLGDDGLVFGDIFGGNAVLPTFFLIATLISGSAVLPAAQPTDIFMTGAGIALTVIYLGGLVVRSRRKVFGMGVDSAAVVAVYLVTVAGLAVL